MVELVDLLATNLTLNALHSAFITQHSTFNIQNYKTLLIDQYIINQPDIIIKCGDKCDKFS